MQSEVSSMEMYALPVRSGFLLLAPQHKATLKFMYFNFKHQGTPNCAVVSTICAVNRQPFMRFRNFHQ